MARRGLRTAGAAAKREGGHGPVVASEAQAGINKAKPLALMPYLQHAHAKPEGVLDAPGLGQQGLGVPRQEDGGVFLAWGWGRALSLDALLAHGGQGVVAGRRLELALAGHGGIARLGQRLEDGYPGACREGGGGAGERGWKAGCFMIRRRERRQSGARAARAGEPHLAKVGRFRGPAFSFFEQAQPMLGEGGHLVPKVVPEFAHEPVGVAQTPGSLASTVVVASAQWGEQNDKHTLRTQRQSAGEATATPAAP